MDAQRPGACAVASSHCSRSTRDSWAGCLSEAAANVVLSFALIFAIGPVGPAVATLLTLAVSNLIIVPWALRRHISMPVMEFAKATALGTGAGLLFAIGTWSFIVAVASDDLARVLLAGIVPALVVAVMAIVWVRDQGLFYRGAALVLDAGFLEALRETREVRASRARLTDLRREGAVSPPGANPLVTVRIATYNRGPLVAKRAIASALAQTYSNLEILVVGDHCDEATEAAVRSVDDPRIVFHNLPKRGTPGGPRTAMAGCGCGADELGSQARLR